MSDAVLVPEEAPADPRRVWASLTPDERSAAYDNSGAVANSADLMAALRTASAGYRTSHASALDVPYGDRERQKIDLFPVAAYGAPCLFFIHGGYWQRNSREGFSVLAEGLASRGWSVAMPSYTLGPEATMTQIVAEIRMALDWLAKNGAAYGLVGPVIVSGWSAGGHLTAMALDHPHVVAGLAISGVFDLAPIRETALNTALHITDDEIVALSPLRLPVVPKPLAIAYGTKEVPALVWDSRRLHAMRAAAHAPGPLIPVSGADHFTILDQLRHPDGELAAAARGLVEGHRSS